MSHLNPFWEPSRTGASFHPAVFLPFLSFTLVGGRTNQHAVVIHSGSERSISPSGRHAQSLDEVSLSPQPPPSTCQHSPLSQEPKDSKSLPVLLYLTGRWTQGGKARAGKPEENSRGGRNCRRVCSLMAGTAAKGSSQVGLIHVYRAKVIHGWAGTSWGTCEVL